MKYNVGAREQNTPKFLLEEAVWINYLICSKSMFNIF